MRFGIFIKTKSSDLSAEVQQTSDHGKLLMTVPCLYILLVLREPIQLCSKLKATLLLTILTKSLMTPFLTFKNFIIFMHMMMEQLKQVMDYPDKAWIMPCWHISFIHISLTPYGQFRCILTSLSTMRTKYSSI
ncbi:hypothetical protein ES708_15153 [subsurface metagenome]